MTKLLHIWRPIFGRTIPWKSNSKAKVTFQFFTYSAKCAGLQHSQKYCITLTVFCHARSRAVSLVGVGGRGDAVESPWVACKFFRIPKISFFDSVTALVKILLQIATVLVTQIHVLGLLGERVYTRVHWRKGGQSNHRPPVNFSEFLVF